jgi:ssDNA-binding Zn-finger/Zn-ribbon topoisomerase 1
MIDTNEIRKEIAQIVSVSGKVASENFPRLATLLENKFGTCPNCGKIMILLETKDSKRFISCIGYPKCITSCSIPNGGIAFPTKKICEHCNFPIVRIKFKDTNSQEMCINNNCPKKFK